MYRKKSVTFWSILLVLVVCVSLVNVRVVWADDGTPTDPPPAVVTDAPSATAPDATQQDVPTAQASDAPSEEATALDSAQQDAPTVQETTMPPEFTPTPASLNESMATATEAATTTPDATVGDLIAQAPKNTDVVVLNQSGEQVPLVSQEAADIVQTADPIWCPANITTPTPGANGCTTSFSSIGDLLANMNSADSASWAANFAQDGVIYLARTTDASTTITSAVTINDTTYSNLFNNFKNYNLTLQGGWNTSTGTTTDQTVFDGANATLEIGTSTNPWIGSVTLNNITIQNVSSTSQASLSVSSGGTVEMNNVVVSGSGAGQNNIDINASNAKLKNVHSSNSNMNGIAITATDAGTVTLMDVIASNNGHQDGSNRYGSGVLVNGASTLINVVGGSYTNDARYGIEATNSASTSLPIANIWTDLPDYSPGSVVTISGNDNSLNNTNVGFLAGETVHVDVTGPNGYAATCDGIADSFGKWSCQITLWASDLAGGSYTYIAVGLTSGISISGSFDDSVSSVTITSPTTSSPVTVTSLPANVTISFNYSTSAGGTTTGTASVIGATTIASNSKALTGGNNKADSITVTIPAGTVNGNYAASVEVSNTSGRGNPSITDTQSNAIIVAILATPTITFDPAPSPTYLGGNFTVHATTNSDGALTYSYVSGPCALVNANTGVFSSSGAGVCVVQANTAATSTFSAGFAQQSVTIAKATPTITFGPAPTPTYLGGNFTVSATTTNTDSGTLTYSVMSGPCAIVSGATFSSTGAGICVVQASGGATTNFNAAAQTQNISIAKATPTLSVSNSPVTYDGSTHSALVSGSVAGSVTNVLTGGASSQTNAATYAVTADFTPTDITNYNSLTGASAGNFVIEQATPVLTVTNSPVTYDGNPHSATVSSSVPGAISNILTGGAATQINVGVYAVAADFTPDDTTNYKSLTGASAGNFTISQLSPTITFDPAPSPTYLGGNFTVHATTNSDGALTYSYVSGPCALVDANTGEFSSTGGGTCVVQANTAATTNFSAGSAQQSVTIAPAAPTITFDPAPSPAYLGGNFTVNAATNSDGALTYSYVSGPCAFVSGATFSSTGAGICVIEADTAATTNFIAGLAQQSVTIAKASQTITATTSAPSNATYNTTFTVAAAASSGLSVAYSSGSPTVCTNSGATFTMVTGTGTCVVQYDQAGDSDFDAAPQITENVTAQKADQTINFAAPASPATFNTTFAVSPTSTSGLPVIVTPSGVCSISGNMVTMMSGTGACVLTASQSGDANYGAAPDVIQTVAAQKANPVITWNNPAAIYVGTALSSTQLNATASIPGSFVYTPSAGTVMSVVGSGQILHVDFTPFDLLDYTPASKDVTISVLPKSSSGTTGGASSGIGGFVPVTGGGAFAIRCSNPAVYNFPVEGFRVSYFNLCNFQGTLEVEQASGLPGKLPNGRPFVKGLTANVIQNGALVNPLPSSSQIQIEFLIPANQQNANLGVLSWNGSQWIEITGQKTADGYFRITTNQPGTFVLVTK